MNSERNQIIFTIIFILLIIISIILYIHIFESHIEQEVAEQGHIELCFTMQSDCATIVATAISESETVSAAFYELNHPIIISALKEKDADVIVFDEEYEDYGKPVKSKGLMHDKFILLNDGAKNIITGSANPTLNDYDKNDNNILIIYSDTLYHNYMEEFEEIKDAKPQKTTEITKVNIGSIKIKNYFCPEDECEEKVVSEINKANKSIYFMTFSFTSDAVGNAVLLKQGLEVQGIFDKSQVASNGQHSEFYKLNASGFDVKIENSPGKLHHKVFIIDEKTVITGSFNPSANANTRNDENIVIIENEEVAQQYLKEFERIWILN